VALRGRAQRGKDQSLPIQQVFAREKLDKNRRPPRRDPRKKRAGAPLAEPRAKASANKALYSTNISRF